MANGHAAAQVPPPPLNGNAAQVPSAGPSEPALADSLDDAFSGRSSGKAQDTRVPVDKSFLAIPEIRRLRDKDDLRFVATQPCLVCGRQPAEAHHLRFAQPSAMGRKVSDAFTVPLCALHHRDLHTTGNERAWWERKKIDPLPVANDLWNQSRGRQMPGDAQVQHPASPTATVSN